MPTDKNRITFYPTQRVWDWWKSLDAHTGTQLINKACELIMTRAPEIFLAETFPTEGVLATHEDGITQVCALHPETKKSRSIIITPLDATIESECGCIFRKLQLDRHWRRLRTGDGVNAQLFEQ